MKHEKEELYNFLKANSSTFYRVDRLSKILHLPITTIHEYVRTMEGITSQYADGRRCYGMTDVEKPKPRWRKPFTEMTPESYKKHVSRGVVSV